MHIVCTPLSAGGRGLNLQPNFQKGGGGDLTGPQPLEGVVGKEEVTFFQRGGMQFSHKK